MQIYTLYCRVLHAKATINISWRRKFYTPFLSSRLILRAPWAVNLAVKIWIIKNIHLNKLCSVYNALFSLVWNKDLQIVNKHLSVTLCQRQTSTKWNNCMPAGHQCLHTSREIITILIPVESNNTDLILEHVFFVYLYNRNRLLI